MPKPENIDQFDAQADFMVLSLHRYSPREIADIMNQENVSRSPELRSVTGCQPSTLFTFLIPE